MSFLENPVVQSILSRQDRRATGTNTEFVRSVLLGLGTQWLANQKPQMKETKLNLMQELANNRDLALKSLSGNYGAVENERNQYNLFLQDKDTYLDNTVNKKLSTSDFYKNLLIDNQMTEEDFNNGLLKKDTDALNVQKRINNWKAGERARYLQQMDEYSKNKFITTKNPFELTKPIHDAYAKELADLNKDPRFKGVVPWLVSKIKKEHGEQAANSIEIQAELLNSNIPSTIQSERTTYEELLSSSKLEQFNNLTSRENYLRSQEPINIKIYEETNKQIESNLQKEDFQNLKYTFNGNQVQIFKPTKKRNVYRIDENGERVLTEDNFNLEIADITAKIVASNQELFEDAGLLRSPTSLMSLTVRALRDTGYLESDGKTTNLTIPSSFQPTRNMIENKNYTEKEILEFILDGAVESSNVPDSREVFQNYRGNKLLTYTSTLQDISDKMQDATDLEEFNNLVLERNRFVEQSNEEIEKDYLTMLISPNTDFKGQLVKYGNNFIELGKISSNIKEELISRFEEKYNVKADDLRAIEQEAPTSTPITDRDTTELDELQRSLEREQQQLTQAERSRTRTLVGRLGLDYVDYYENRVKRIQDKLKTSEDKFVDVDFDFITSAEGFETNMYVPAQDGKVFENSGPTIAVGADLGTKDKKYFKGLSTDIIKKIEPYFGLKGQEALTFVQNNPLELSEEETLEIAKFVKNKELNAIRKQFSKKTGKNFSKLRPEIQTIVASTAFQYGASGVPKFYDLAAKTIDNLNVENVTNLQQELLNFTSKTDEETGEMLYLNRRTAEAEYLSNLISSLKPSSLLSRQ